MTFCCAAGNCPKCKQARIDRAEWEIGVRLMEKMQRMDPVAFSKLVTEGCSRCTCVECGSHKVIISSCGACEEEYERWEELQRARTSKD